MNTTEKPVIVDPQGKPARVNDACQTCGKGKEYRQPVGAFGVEKYHCKNCGSDW